ncbi:MAG: hypothetical protein JSS77_03935 [Acidobacteria bacterium]|nr:hypothetical protein [Acidobacteriota bacterium]
METVSVKIREPKAKQLLKDLEDLDLIELDEPSKISRPKRRFGAMKGLVEFIADDFDKPLDDLKDHM